MTKGYNINVLPDESFPKRKEKAKMTKILGEKCLTQGELSGVLTRVLLDTGAQVSIFRKKQSLENFINAKIRAI